MAQEITNFARFYATFNRIPYRGDREDFKKEMVSRATLGRTDSLREVTRREYQDLCAGMEKSFPLTESERARLALRDALRRRRSICLKLMQQLGIDTTDWTRINAFCQDARIAGQPFGRLDSEALDALSIKLRMILRKGGLRSSDGVPTATIVPFNR